MIPRKKQLPYPVWVALEYLGATDVPRVRGTTKQAMLCPFHTDKHKSAGVSEYGFTCFACGVRGDAVKLIREQEGVDYKTAIAVLQERTGGEDRSGDPGRAWGESLLG